MTHQPCPPMLSLKTLKKLHDLDLFNIIQKNDSFHHDWLSQEDDTGCNLIHHLFQLQRESIVVDIIDNIIKRSSTKNIIADQERSYLDAIHKQNQCLKQLFLHRDNQHNAPIHFVCIRNHATILKRLLNRNPDPSLLLEILTLTNSQGQTVMHLCCAFNRPDSLHYLFSQLHIKKLEQSLLLCLASAHTRNPAHANGDSALLTQHTLFESMTSITTEQLYERMAPHCKHAVPESLQERCLEAPILADKKNETPLHIAGNQPKFFLLLASKLSWKQLQKCLPMHNQQKKRPLDILLCKNISMPFFIRVLHTIQKQQISSMITDTKELTEPPVVKQPPLFLNLIENFINSKSHHRIMEIIQETTRQGDNALHLAAHDSLLFLNLLVCCRHNGKAGWTILNNLLHRKNTEDQFPLDILVRYCPSQNILLEILKFLKDAEHETNNTDSTACDEFLTSFNSMLTRSTSEKINQLINKQESAHKETSQCAIH